LRQTCVQRKSVITQTIGGVPTSVVTMSSSRMAFTCFVFIAICSATGSEDVCPSSTCREDPDTDESYLLAKPFNGAQHEVDDDPQATSPAQPCATNYGEVDSCCGQLYATAKDAGE